MKTTVLFRMMVLVAMVVAGIANTELKAQDNNFITNEEKVDDLVVSKVIYRLVYARWNNSHRAYDDSVEKSVYELNDANMPIAYMNYKWNDYKWIEESAGNWAMNIQTPVTDEADLLLAGR